MKINYPEFNTGESILYLDDKLNCASYRILDDVRKNYKIWGHLVVLLILDNSNPDDPKDPQDKCIYMTQI